MTEATLSLCNNWKNYHKTLCFSLKGEFLLLPGASSSQVLLVAVAYSVTVVTPPFSPGKPEMSPQRPDLVSECTIICICICASNKIHLYPYSLAGLKPEVGGTTQQL